MRSWDKTKEVRHRSGQSKPEGRKQEVKVPPYGKGNPKPEKLLWMSAEGRIFSALSVGPEWDESHEASYLLSYHHLHRPNDEMKLPNFLRPPKIHRRKRSKARSELGIGPVEDQNEADPVVPRRTESTPDLQIDTSSLPKFSPLSPRDQESNGM